MEDGQRPEGHVKAALEVMAAGPRREDELHPIEVVLTYLDGEAVMLVVSAPTNDYDSSARANAWVSRAKTGRCRVVAMMSVNGNGAADGDATTEHQRRCSEKDCVLDPGHGLAHQDRTGEMWDESDVLGARVINPAREEARQAVMEGSE